MAVTLAYAENLISSDTSQRSPLLSMNTTVTDASLVAFNLNVNSGLSAMAEVMLNLTHRFAQPDHDLLKTLLKNRN